MSHTRECVYAIVEHSWIVVVYSERWNVQDMTVFPESKTSGNCMGEETKKLYEPFLDSEVFRG